MEALDLQKLATEYGVDALNLYHYDSASQTLTLVQTQGLSAESVGYRIPVDRGIVGKVAREHKAISTKDPMNHPDFHLVEGSGEEQFATFLGIPLISFDQLLGVLVLQTVEHKRYRLSEMDSFYRLAKKLISQMSEAA